MPDDNVVIPMPVRDTVQETPRGDASSAIAVEPLGLWDAGTADYENIRPRQWLLGNTFCRGVVSGVSASGGAAKTTVRLTQAISVATGKELTGEHVFQQGRVLFISLEDDDTELHRRIKAVKLHHRVADIDLARGLFVATPKGKRLVERQDSHGPLELGPLYAELVAAIEKHEPALVVLDPFVKCHGVDENSNVEIDFVMTKLTELAIQHNVAIDTPHHVAKASSGQAGDANRSRGASARIDAMRIAQTLTTMTKDEAEGFGIAEDQRRFYVRLDSAKANMAPPGETALWFKLVGVPLGNGTPGGPYPNGDTVQTVERWLPPNVIDALSLDRETETAILSQIARGPRDGVRYSAQPTAKDQAWEVVKAHCTVKTDAQCKKIIAKWLETRVLQETTYRHPEYRSDRLGLVVVPF